MAKRVSNKKAKQMIKSCIDANYGTEYAEWRRGKLMMFKWHKQLQQGVFTWYGKPSEIH